MPPVGPRPQLPVGTCRFSIEGTVNGYPWANIMHCNPTGFGNMQQVDMDNLLTLLLDAYQDNFKASFPATWIADKCKGVIRKSASISLVSDISVTVAGTLAGTSALPMNVAISVGWRIPLYYRGGHPRTYLCGVPANQIADARMLATTYRSSIQTAANSFLAQVNAITTGNVTAVALVALSYVSGGAWRATPAPFAITSATVDRRLDSQRRRLGRDI